MNILVIKNFNKDKFKDSNIQKELCKIYDGDYRRKYKPKQYLRNIIFYCMNHGKWSLNTKRMSIENTSKLLTSLNLENYVKSKYEYINDNNIIMLNGSEYLCPDCEGFGKVFYDNIVRSKNHSVLILKNCTKCFCTRKIVWIDEIKNHESRHNFYTHYYFLINDNGDKILQHKTFGKKFKNLNGKNKKVD